jgi:hypothetical protein
MLRIAVVIIASFALVGTAQAARIWLYNNAGAAFGSANRTPPPPSGDIFVPAGMI